MRLTLLAAAAVALFAILPAAAQDRQPCGAGLVCANNPETVVQALAKANFAPKPSTDGDGDPMIEAGGGPYRFSVYFYGCEKHRNCDSLRFEVTFDKDPAATIQLANKWNADHRFVSAAVKPDGRFVLSYDVATIGGATQRNFADTLDWWNSMLNEAAEFFTRELAVKG